MDGGTKYVAVIALYIVALLLVGYFCSRKAQMSKDDFFIAGRRLPFLVLVGTLLATWFGGGTVVGGANFTYTRGPWAAIFFFLGAPLGALVLCYLAPKIREKAAYTVPEILESRYGPLARLLATICILLAYTGIVSYQFTGAAYVVNLITGIPHTTATIISAAVMVFLAVTAGMVSVAYTDAFSALLILVGMGLGIPFVLSSTGGWGHVYSQLSASQQTMSGGLTFMQLLGYFFPLFFLYLGDQNQIQRYGCAKDAKESGKSALYLFFGMLLVICLVIFYSVSAVPFLPGIKPDTAILQMAIKAVPFAIGSMILCAAVAFMITTGDSFLLSAASNIMLDIVQKYFKRDITEKGLIRGTQVTIVLLGLLSYVMAKFFPSVLAMQMYSYSMYGAAVTPALLAVFLWKKVSRAGGVVSILTGGASVLIWEIGMKRPMGWNSILVAVPLAVLTLVVFSFLFPDKAEELEPVPEQA